MKFQYAARSAPLALVFLIASCSLIPDVLLPQRKDIADNLQYKGIGENTAVPESEPGMQVCVSNQLSALATFENDPQLQHLLTITRAQNLELKAAELRIQESQAIKSQAWSALFPTLGLQLSALRADNRGQFNNLPPQVHEFVSSYITDKTTTSYGSRLGITGYEVDVWGRMRSIAKSAEASLAAQVKAKELTLVEVHSEVMISYYELMHANLLRKVVLKEAAVAKRINAKLEVLKQEGRLSQIELRKAQLDPARYENAIRSAEQQIHTQYGRLFLLTGDAQLLHQRAIPLARDADVRNASSTDEHARYIVDAKAVLLRPDVEIAELNIVAAHGKVGAARAAFFPMLTLDMSTGRDSSHFSDIFNFSGAGWSIAPNLYTSIFDFGKKNANLKQAKAQASASLIEYQKTLDKAYQDIQSAIDKLELSRLGVRQFVQQQTRLDELRTIMGKAKKTGLMSELELLNLELSLFTYDLDGIEARRAMALSRVLLYKALGGRYVESCQAGGAAAR